MLNGTLLNNPLSVASNIASAKEALKAAKQEEILRKQIKEKFDKINITKKLLPITTRLGLKPLAVDSLGRVLDESGNVMQHKPIMHSSLKINQNFEREQRQKEAVAAAAAPDRTKADKTAKKVEHSQYVDPTLNAVKVGKTRHSVEYRFTETTSHGSQLC